LDFAHEHLVQIPDSPPPQIIQQQIQQTFEIPDINRQPIIHNTPDVIEQRFRQLLAEYGLL
jgi:hypothetical protein